MATQHNDSQSHKTPHPQIDMDTSHGAATSDGFNMEDAKQSVKNAAHKATTWLEDTFPGKSNAVFFAICGLLAAIAFIAIGFWRSMLLIVFVISGYAFGQSIDGNPTIINSIKRALKDLFSSRNHR
ncbi:DUF2273 domain-containing protein [Atopobium fossor]|uniref:DUF2273 domain-containing protein n=1 Tax=Atopobium fossor TaxID=39487 RepID=UPI00041DFC20|nr:DUF2273 domain-containing protein [Atopobium fossor]